MTPEAKAYCERMTQRIAELEQQVAALTMERESHFKQIAHYCEHLAATQAREAKLRSALLSLRGPFGWGKGSPQEEAIALPSDDSALMERLKQERLEGYNEGYADADAILTGIDRSLT